MSSNNALFFQNDNLFEDEDIGATSSLAQSTVHIRCFQRTSRKYVTTIEGLDEDLSLRKIAKYMRKTFHCQADVFRVEQDGIKMKIIKLQGDQRDNAKKFLVEENIISEKRIKVHGF